MGDPTADFPHEPHFASLPLNRPLLLGIGTAAPRYKISQAISARVARSFVHRDDQSSDVLPALYRMTRVKYRGSVLLEGPSEKEVQQSFYPPASAVDDRGPSTAERMERFTAEAAPLAVRSARGALADASIDATAVSHLVTVTCTGFYAPGIDVELIEKLGLPLDIERVQVGFMGCHGAINGLRVARALSEADPQAVVLVVAVELCSLHYQYGWDTDRVVSNALFADGSGAVVVGRGESQVASALGAGRVQVLATGSRLVPQSRDAMTWGIGDHGFEMTLSATVPGLIESSLEPFVRGWLAKRGLDVEGIGGWAVHPGGPRILTAVEDALRLPGEALEISRCVLADHGNMSSATLLFVLEHFRAQRVPGPWLMLGFGPGLEIEVALLAASHPQQGEE